jgi:hypothetical protein
MREGCQQAADLGGLARVIASLGRAVAEQRLGVIAAEQEREAVQVLAQLCGAVGRVADVAGGRSSTGARHPAELGGEVLKARLAHPAL